MKKIIYSILAIAGLISLSSCDNELEIGFKSNGIHMILKTDCAELITKATAEGDDTLNENKIQTIHYYFFDANDGSFVYDNTQTINKTGEADILLTGINGTKFNEIFNGRTTLNVLAVVNATTPAGTSTTTMDDIKATVVTLSGFGKQDNFVMTGEGVLTKTDDKTAETEISLKRLASKITLHLLIPGSYEDTDHKVWTPQFDAAQIDFENLGKNILVNGAQASSPVLSNVTRKSTSSDFTLKDTLDGKKISIAVPVYSYPRQWSNGDEKTPYIYVTLPWKTTDGITTTADTYYKVLLPGSSLSTNSWYDITARLGGLGSLVKEGSTTLDDLTIKVTKEWKNAINDENINDTDADLDLPRVLAVEKNKYIIYNQDEIVIPFVSSHDCIVDTVGMIDQDSHPNEMGAQQDVTVTIDNEAKTITFKHNLLNDQSYKPYDYLIFKAHFTLKHDDNDHFSETIYIEQRPALCVDAFDNSSGYRNVFVNGTQEQATSTRYNADYWGVLYGSDKNTNVLQITASVLPTTGSMSSYRIGDPRIRTQNQMLSAPFNSDLLHSGTSGKKLKETTDVNGNTLIYYYAAGTETKDIIAPSFRISSSYGGTRGEDHGAANTYTHFQLRCAAYQEAGYPAGRWRLPTEAELYYCLKLQADGCLGNGIFNDSGDATPTYYLSASGNSYGIKTEGGVKSVVSRDSYGTNVRCVYDAWYWDNTSFPRLPENQYLYDVCGDTNSNYKFVWGDQPINW